MTANSDPDSTHVLTRQLLDPAVPAGFRLHVLEKTWRVGAPRQVAWDWLNDTKTFTRGQIPPFKVEFLDLPDGSPGGFVPGCLNAHHGPLMSFHGVIGEVRAPEYRDLLYCYGSYAISLRLARPVRLQFWFEEVEGGKSLIRLRLDTHTRAWFRPIWGGVNHFFWWSFGVSARLVLAWRARKA
ncbi:MAG: hypothetical protein AAGG01_03300 [Planctomycetota bacterium]